MKLIKFISDDNPVFINPEHVIAVRKGMKDTAIHTIGGHYAVRETVEIVVRLLGAEEVPRDITPVLPKAIDL